MLYCFRNNLHMYVCCDFKVSRYFNPKKTVHIYVLPKVSFQKMFCLKENVTNFNSFLEFSLEYNGTEDKWKVFCVCRTGATETSFLLSRPTLRNRETTLERLLLGALICLNLGDFWQRRRIRLLRAWTHITTLMVMAKRKWEKKEAKSVYYHWRQTSTATKLLDENLF